MGPSTLGPGVDWGALSTRDSMWVSAFFVCFPVFATGHPTLGDKLTFYRVVDDDCGFSLKQNGKKANAFPSNPLSYCWGSIPRQQSKAFCWQVPVKRALWPSLGTRTRAQFRARGRGGPRPRQKWVLGGNCRGVKGPGGRCRHYPFQEAVWTGQSHQRCSGKFLRAGSMKQG